MTYDFERDEWSIHYYDMVNTLIRGTTSTLEPSRILDIGTGTGNHLLFYASTGAMVCGVDLARNMLRVATYKTRQNRLASAFIQGDGQHLPLGNETFDLVACCGSVLNYCDDYRLALTEMCRVLRPHGTLIVGFDNSVSPDSAWVLLDALAGHGLGFRSTANEALRRLSRSAAASAYPHITSEGEIHYVCEKFIRLGDVTSCIKKNGLKLKRYYGVHTLSGFIPFTLASNPKAKEWVKRITRDLSELDSTLWGLRGINRFAYHILAIAAKS